MTTFTKTDLKRLEDLIIASREENREKFTALEQKFTGLETGQEELNSQIVGLQREISDFRVGIGRVEGSLQGQQPFIQKIPELVEKVGELKNWRQIVIITLTATISSTITWAIRGGSFKPQAILCQLIPPKQA